MANVYLALATKESNANYDPLRTQQASQIFTDDLKLAQYIQAQWDCYIFTGLKKVGSVETTIIEESQ